MGGDGKVDQLEPDVISHSNPVVFLDSSHFMYLRIAHIVGDMMGTCVRRNVGAVLVSNGRQRELGWNGMERSENAATCMGGGCPRGFLSAEEQPHGVGYSNCVYLHAELNAAENFRHSQRARSLEGWARPLGVTIYTSSVPCEDCLKYAAWAGIDLVWEGTDGNQDSTRQDP
jgi:deoxycytidylate deaminase